MGTRVRDKSINHHDIDSRDGAEFNQQAVVGDDKGSEACCRSGICQKVGIADALDHSGKGFDLVPVQPVFVMVFIQKEDTVLHPDHDQTEAE